MSRYSSPHRLIYFYHPGFYDHGTFSPEAAQELGLNLLGAFASFVASILMLCAPLPGLAQMRVDQVLVHGDADGRLSIDQIVGLPDAAFSVVNGTFSAGYTRTVHWLRIKVVPPSGTGETWLLDVHPPYLDDIRLYEPDPVRPGEFIEHRAGDMQPFSSRDVAYRGAVFKLSATDGRLQQIHVRVATTSASLFLARMWVPEAFFNAVPLEYSLLGGVYGVMAIILLINLIYWWVQREALVLYYLAYIAASLGNSLIVHGFAAQFFAQDAPVALNHFQFFFAVMMAATGARLYHKLLLVTPANRRLNKLYWVMTVFPLFLIPVYFLGGMHEAARILITTSSLLICANIVRSIWLIRQEVPGSRLIAFATVAGLLPLLLTFLQVLGVMSAGFIVLHSLLIGLLASIIALHVALGARMRNDREAQMLALQRARKAEADAQREREGREEQAHFMSMLAHELRSPIAGIAAATDSIEILDGGQSDSIGERIRRIRAGVSRLRGISDRYLQMDRADNARLDPNMRICHPGELIDALVALTSADQSRIVVKVESDSPLTGDPELIVTALLNLVDNGIKYSPADTPVEITVGVIAPGWIEFAVADRGKGVPDALKEAVFRRYFRSAEHGKVPGLGIGLALVREITSLHTGTVHVLDREGGGAVFCMKLPIKPPDVRK